MVKVGDQPSSTIFKFLHIICILYLSSAGVMIGHVELYSASFGVKQ